MSEQVQIACGAADKNGVRYVVATLGEKTHPDRFDTDNAFRRSAFCEKIIGKFRLGEDAHEWLNDEVVRVADDFDASPQEIASLKVISAADIEPATAEFLMPGFIPKGAITTVEGDPGDGKSQAVISFIARVTRGIALPPADSAEGMLTPQNIILSNFEDDPERVIVPRLIAAGADLRRVKLIREVSGIDGLDRLLCLPVDIPRIEQQIIHDKAVIWVLDVFVAALDSAISVNNDADIRRVTSQLSAMAERTGCSIILIRHLNKKAGNHALYRGGGSIGIAGASRSVLLVGRDPEDSDARILASVKSNLCQSPPSIRFHIEPHGDTSRVVWGDQCEVVANDLLVVERKPTAGGKKQEQAAAIMEEMLANGPRNEADVVQAMNEAGIGIATYKRARSAIGVLSEKTGYQGKWVLTLPESKGYQNEF